MIRNIINFLFYFLLITSIVIALYGFYIIRHGNLNKYKNKLPFPFESAYNVLSNISVFSEFLNYLQRAFFLIYVDRVKSELLSALVVTLVPSLVIIMYGVLSSFCPVWYLNLATLILCCSIPFYIIKSYLNKKCLYLRMDLLNSYTTMTSLLNGNSIMSILDEVINSTYGSTKKIYLEFARIYPVDKQEAYDFLKYISGDVYTHSVVDSLVRYDYDGKDTTSEINETCKQGLSIYGLQREGFASFLDLKLSSIVMSIACVFLIFVGKHLANTMKFEYNDTIGYVCILIAISSLGLTFMFESN